MMSDLVFFTATLSPRRRVHGRIRMASNVRFARCGGHSAAVRTLDWSVDGAVLQSACAAGEVLYWDGRSGRQVRENQRDTRWATWTSLLGFPAMGVWYGGADGTDVNAVCCDASQRWLVAADDRGLVRLLAYPCMVERAASRGYVGHSAHVTCVRFNCEANAGAVRLLSCGGADRAVFQFTLHEVPPQMAAPPEPEPVWAALDKEGKVFGWTAAPVVPVGEDAHGGTGGVRAVADGGDDDDDDAIEAAGSVMTGFSDTGAGGWDGEDVGSMDGRG